MNIELNIEVASAEELKEAVTGLAGIMGAAATQPEARKSQKRETPKPTESKPQVEESDPAPEAPEEDNKPEDPPEEIPSVVDLRAAAQEKGKTPEGKKAIKALLEEFGSKSISDVPEEKRIAFLQKLGEL